MNSSLLPILLTVLEFKRPKMERHGISIWIHCPMDVFFPSFWAVGKLDWKYRMRKKLLRTGTLVDFKFQRDSHEIQIYSRSHEMCASLKSLLGKRSVCIEANVRFNTNNDVKKWSILTKTYKHMHWTSANRVVLLCLLAKFQRRIANSSCKRIGKIEYAL